MERIKTTLQAAEISIRSWTVKNKLPMFLALVLSTILYFPMICDGLENLDSFCTPEPYWADLWDRIPYWETIQGRWALRWSDTLFYGVHAYFFTVLLVSVLFCLAVLIVCDLLEVNNLYIRCVVTAVFVCSQYVMNIQTYRYCSAAYAASFFLAVLSVYCARHGRLAGVVYGAVSLAVSLGFYQSSLGVTGSLCLFVLIRQLMQRKKLDKGIQEIFVRLLVMGAVGTLLYLLILKLALVVYGASLAGINGINQVGPSLLPRLPHGILQAYKDFFAYFLSNQIAQNYYLIRAVNIVLILATGLRLLYALCRSRKSAGVWLAVCLSMALIPAAANITDIINPTTQIALRMAGGMSLLPVFCFAVLSMESRFSLQKVTVFALALVLLRGNLLQSNNDIEVMRADKKQAITVGNQILLQLSAVDEYQQGAPVAIVGCPINGTFGAPATQYREKANVLIQWGLFWGDLENNRDAWRRLMEQEMGVAISWSSYEQEVAVCESEDFQEMPCFPQEGSIAVIDGVVVVRVSK